jgi:hypothetical protein
MKGYGLIENKDKDDPDPAKLYYCGEKPLRADSTTSDGINSSIELEKSDLTAIRAEGGDTVLLYVEANGKWVASERDVYPSRPGIGLYLDEREALELDPEDAIEVWIGEVESVSQDDEEDCGARQQSLSDPEVAEENYVLITDEPLSYHHINQSSGAVTECGIGFGDKEYRTFSDPGDALEECRDCSLRAGTDMTNQELVDWLGEEANFETDDGDAPGYLSKTQLIALRNHISNLNDQLEETQEDQPMMEGT